MPPGAEVSPTARSYAARAMRLVRPSLVFFAVWGTAVGATVPGVLRCVGHDRRRDAVLDVGAPTGPHLIGGTTLLRLFLPPGATLPFGPLWFLGVYLVVVVIAPSMVALHRRFRWWVPIAMIVGAVCADLARFQGGISALRWCNVAFVLLLPHQLGFFYADDTFDRAPKAALWGMVAAGLGGLAMLTTAPFWQLFGDARFRRFPGIGYYPKSMLGTDLEVVSNAYPPSVCFLLGGIWTIGAVMLARPYLRGWLRHRRPWRVTIAVNGVIMTLFLWHMTAYLAAVLVLWPLGLAREHDSTAAWWLQRPLIPRVSGLFLFALIAIFGRFERPRTAP